MSPIQIPHSEEMEGLSGLGKTSTIGFDSGYMHQTATSTTALLDIHVESDIMRVNIEKGQTSIEFNLLSGSEVARNADG